VKLSEGLEYPGLKYPAELVEKEERECYVEDIGRTRQCIVKIYFVEKEVTECYQSITTRTMQCKVEKKKIGEMTLYIDKSTGWILQIDYKEKDFTMTLTLKETNIPGLRELVSG